MLSAFAVFMGCSDTTGLGGDEEYVSPKNESTTATETDYRAKFVVKGDSVVTEYQEVTVDVTNKKGNEVIKEDVFKIDLDLHVNFTAPEKVYVAKEIIEKVEAVQTFAGELTTKKDEKKNFDLITATQNFQITLNGGEEILATAGWQKASCSGTVLSHTEVTSVNFVSATSIKNETLSNKDSLVYDVTAKFAVDLTGIIEGESSVETKNVNVLYQRVYKFGDNKIGDKIDEDNICREVESLDDTTLVERFMVPVYEDWSVSGRKNERVDTLELTVRFVNPANQVVFSKNADYKTTAGSVSYGAEMRSTSGNWTINSKPMNYASSASNNLNPFKNAYSATTNAVTYKLGDQVVKFPYGVWSVKEGKTTIDGPKDVTYLGNSYQGYDYDNNVDWTYSVKVSEQSKASEASGKGHSDVLILIVQDEIKDELQGLELVSAKREIVNNTTERFTIIYAEKWSVSGQKNEKTETKDVVISFTGPKFKEVFTTNANYTTTGGSVKYGQETSKTDGHWTIKTRSLSYFSNAVNDVNNFANDYNGSSASVVYKNGAVSVTFEFGSWSVAEGKTTITPAGEETRSGKTYETYDYVNNNTWTYSIKGLPYVVGNSSASASSSANVLILIEKQEEQKEDVLVDKHATDVHHQIVDEYTDKFTWTEVESWSESGEKRNQKEWIRYRHFYDPNTQSYYVSSVNYTTPSGTSSQIRTAQSKSGNVTVTTYYMKYVANSNGEKNFDNVYNYDYQSGIYSDPDGKYTLDFKAPTWTISDNGATVTENGTSGDYKVYDHLHKVSHTYTAEGDSYNGNAKSLVKLYVKNNKQPGTDQKDPEDDPKPEEPKDPTPDFETSWGKIIGLGVSAVPARDVSGHYAVFTWCLLTEKGAVVARTNENTMPTKEQFKSGNFVEGSFDASYNGGWWNKSESKWYPAAVTDESKYIKMRYQGRVKDRVSFTDLKIWGFRGGNITSVVNGVTATVNNDILTVTYNGQTLVLYNGHGENK